MSRLIESKKKGAKKVFTTVHPQAFFAGESRQRSPRAPSAPRKDVGVLLELLATEAALESCRR